MDLQIKKYPKTDAKILSISPLSVFSARQSLMGEIPIVQRLVEKTALPCLCGLLIWIIYFLEIPNEEVK
ncbi:hypothetical protein CDG76_35265 [Nostoc sp. 'Peltigera membranacea cyanobiont' 210A]|uniref:hypothetical protein n=1 Tax=Nostoc sp. 'Peltigera membranacea cyanobiont' 210A TaxID=2014529 RepID=UPI000B955D96|nr:hypothetical protein [Nostoc sp. 'Peltigera membranacea cyanobiont' 210A]OYD89401.1 hypothetical protein CDG76_35265 [Nostoc sp. 'Peltigera membranacea cyanobiont' 210A]